MLHTRVKIRGIYTTALTGLLLENRYLIIEPSEPIQDRFNLPFVEGPEDILVLDKKDKHGVVLRGKKQAVESLLALLKEMLPDMAVRRRNGKPARSRFSSCEKREGDHTVQGEEFPQEKEERIEIEFPQQTKIRLDELRARWVPTLPYHHSLKTARSEEVNGAEGHWVAPSPGVLCEQATSLRQELVFSEYAPGHTLWIHHVKPSGRVFQSRGKVQQYTNKRLMLLRTFKPGGTYDALELPKEPGDWGIIEAEEGAWHFRRRYFTGKGALKGEIYNINTPVEFLPGGIRYLDLELDVVKKAGELPRLIDCPHLERMARRGILTPSLVKKAWETAYLLLFQLQSENSLRFL